MQLSMNWRNYTPASRIGCCILNSSVSGVVICAIEAVVFGSRKRRQNCFVGAGKLGLKDLKYSVVRA